jgi:transposase InsO family protein
VSQGWVSRLVARYRAEGEAAFESRSRRPKTSPTALAPDTVELIVRIRKELTEQGLDAGPETIAWHLQQHHQLRVSRTTISRHLTAHGLVVPTPRKRPRSSYIRFQAELPNETWQADFTHYRLADPAGTDTEILTWLDDCSRYALHMTCWTPVTGPIVLKTFRQAVAAHGIPASTLTDNGMVFTTRLAGGRGGRNALEHELRRLHITQKNSAPNHPTTCGKDERFQQTMKNWLRAQPDQPATLPQLQDLIDHFTHAYNHTRPHRSLPHRATSATIYTTRPKALPTHSRDADTHTRIRHDRIDTTGVVTLRLAGRLHHIGVGRTHAGTHVIMLVNDLDLRIVNATTGELLRDLTINPNRDYQPTGRPPGPQRQWPRTQSWVRGHSDVLRHHRAEAVGFEPTVTGYATTVFKNVGEFPSHAPDLRRYPIPCDVAPILAAGWPWNQRPQPTIRGAARVVPRHDLLHIRCASPGQSRCCARRRWSSGQGVCSNTITRSGECAWLASVCRGVRLFQCEQEGVGGPRARDAIPAVQHEEGNARDADASCLADVGVRLAGVLRALHHVPGLVLGNANLGTQPYQGVGSRRRCRCRPCGLGAAAHASVHPARAARRDGWARGRPA